MEQSFGHDPMAISVFQLPGQVPWRTTIYGIPAALSENELPLARKDHLPETDCSCRYYISRHSLDSLNNVGLICFRGGSALPWVQGVCQEIKRCLPACGRKCGHAAESVSSSGQTKYTATSSAGREMRC